MKTIRNLLALSALLATAPIVPAAVPSTINYQGRLTNAAGVPQAGTRSMSLKIYDAATAATAGTQLYTETIGEVTVDANGVYSFQFGAAGISEALAVGAEHWLELTVDGVAQSLRQKLLAVPFAMKSADNQELMILFQTKIDSVIPPGTVIAYAGDSVPSGWLKCDGTAISRDDHSRLFQVVNTAHGIGNGSSTFNLPDYRGRFLRCIDGNTGRDPDVLSRTEMPGEPKETARFTDW